MRLTPVIVDLMTPVGASSCDLSLESPFTENFLRNSCRNLENLPSEGDEANASTESESDEERRQREEKESELLAWQMMREDNLEIYQMQMQYMQENANGMSEDDFNALQQVINESGQQADYEQPNFRGVRRDSEDGSVHSEAEDEEEGDGNESDPETWDYERLLELGNAIGGMWSGTWLMYCSHDRLSRCEDRALATARQGRHEVAARGALQRDHRREGCMLALLLAL